jgi:hypothetical protein
MYYTPDQLGVVAGSAVAQCLVRIHLIESTVRTVSIQWTFHLLPDNRERLIPQDAAMDDGRIVTVKQRRHPSAATATAPHNVAVGT